jgi:hypothetical protein
MAAFRWFSSAPYPSIDEMHRESVGYWCSLRVIYFVSCANNYVMRLRYE